MNEEVSRQLLEEHPIGTKSDLVIGMLINLYDVFLKGKVRFLDILLINFMMES